MQLARPKKNKERATQYVPSAPPREELPAESEVPDDAVAVAPPSSLPQEYAAPPLLEHVRQLVATSAPAASPAVLYPRLRQGEQAAPVSLGFFHVVEKDEEHAHNSSGRDKFLCLLQRFREMVVRHYGALEASRRLEQSCQTLEESCWTREVRYVTEKRLCGDNVAVEERHEFVFAQLQRSKLEELRKSLDALKDANFCSNPLSASEMDLAFEDLLRFLQDFLGNWLGTEEHGEALGDRIVALHPDEQLGQWKAVAAELRHFVCVLLRESGSLPADTSAGRSFRLGVETLLKIVAAPLHRISSVADVVLICRAVVATPSFGSTVFLLQMPPKFEAMHHVVLALQLLKEVLVRPDLSDPAAEDEWVLLRQSADGNAEDADGSGQLQDDLELLFAQLRLPEMVDFALNCLQPHESFEVARMTLRLLLGGARKFASFPHFARLLGQCAVRVVNVWAPRSSAGDSDSLCADAFSLLLGEHHMWCFLRDLPFEMCSQQCTMRFFGELRSTVTGAGVLDKLTLQTATHVLGACERMAASHAKMSASVVDFLVDVGFVLPASSALTYKLCRSLIGSICSNDPSLVSHILDRVARERRWPALHYLSRELPTMHWVPSEGDLAVLRQALMQVPESPDSKAARQLIDGVDLGWRDDVLVVGAIVHRSLAIMAVEVMTWHDDYFAKNNSWFGWRSLAGSREAVELFDWLWNLAERTKHADLAGNPLLEPLDLSLPVAVALRPREIPSVQEAESSNSASLSAWMAISIARFSTPLVTIPTLLSKLAACTNPRAESAFHHALASAAPLLAKAGDLSAVVETVRQVTVRSASGGFLLDPLWMIMGSSKPRQTGAENWLAVLCPRQILAATTISRDAASGLAGFWCRLLTSIPGWSRLAQIRSAMDAIARACVFFDVFGAFMSNVVGVVQLNELSEAAAGGGAASWSPSALVPNLLFSSAQWSSLRERLSGWAQSYPFLSLLLILLEVRRQNTEWRIIGRTGEQTFKDANNFAIFQLAGVCERLSVAAEPLTAVVLFWQMFFLLYFERSPVGKLFAPEFLRAKDAQLVSRLAASLERLSARTNSPVFNAFSLWLRFDGPPVALLDTWMSLPATFAGPLLLQRFSKGQSLFEKDVAWWIDLVPDTKASRLELLGGRSLAPGAAGLHQQPQPPLSMRFSKLRVGLSVFSPSEPLSSPRMYQWHDRVQSNSWASSGAGLRAALLTELDNIEEVSRSWHDKLALTTALQCELVESVAGRFNNVAETRVVNKHCGKGSLSCARAAQFVFNGTVVVTVKKEQDRINQVHASLSKAMPRVEDTRKAVAASVRLEKLVAYVLHGIVNETETGRLVFFRLADMSAGTPFPPLLEFSKRVCDKLAAKFLAVNAEEEILTRILARPERAALLSPFFAPHKSGEGFVRMFKEVTESKVCDEALRAVLLGRFQVSSWLELHNPSVASCTVFAEFLLRTIATTASPAHHERTCAVLARYQFPHLLLPILDGLIEGEARLQGHTWDALLLEGDWCANIRDKATVERVATILGSFLWRKRGVRNPPRSVPLLDSSPHWASAAAQLACQLVRAKAFRGPTEDEPYGLMRSADPQAAWRTFVDLFMPYTQTLSVQQGSRPSSSSLHFPPWSSNSNGAELVHHVWAPTLAHLVRQWPAVLLQPCWELMCNLVPFSPPFVQGELCTVFAHVPWEHLEASTEPFARSVGTCYAEAGFRTVSLANFLAHVMARLPLFQGTIEIANEETAISALISVMTLAMAASDAVLPSGLPGVWKRLEESLLKALLHKGSLWVQDAGRKCLEVRIDARPQLAACLNVLEILGAQRDDVWIGPILMGQLLPGRHLVRTLFVCFFFFGPHYFA